MNNFKYFDLRGGDIELFDGCQTSSFRIGREWVTAEEGDGAICKNGSEFVFDGVCWKAYDANITNGKKLMQTFPDSKYEVREYVVLFEFGGCKRELPIGWWNAPYIRKGE